MSINQYSSDIPETLWWAQQQQQQQQAVLMKPIQNPSTSGPPVIHPPWSSQLYHPRDHQTSWFNSHTPRDAPPSSAHPASPRFNLNQDDEEEDDDDNGDQNSSHVENPSSRSPTGEGEDEKEPMFEKPLTPSDVGKLNRLVIPKQHAEKYFPLGANSGESKGLLLGFEDESGKCWRFRYSYWNSSQSYVLTKGWSRYVKEKRLDAGDVVFFERHRADTQRLFINWRRRPQQQQSSGSAPAHFSRAVVAATGCGSDGSSNRSNKGVGVVGMGVGVGWTRGFYSAHPYPTHQPLPYQPDCLHAGLSLYTYSSHSIHPIFSPFLPSHSFFF